MPAIDEDPLAAVFADARGGGRALRATWHPESQMLVLSVWRDGLCIASHRLPAQDLAPFAHLITDTIADAHLDASTPA
ncbi:MAG: hypothetical protein JWM93_1654 [Frankiales bacterium]|nr:hypothetical protein [Frankiales bacterium]